MVVKEFSADYVYTGVDVIQNATVQVSEANTIVGIKEGRSSNHLDGAICPGFINSHCHLELSFMFNKIKSGTGLIDFVKRVVAIRDDFTEVQQQQAIKAANQQMWDNGIQAVGDISNDIRSFSVKNSSPVRYHTFVEVFDLHPSRTTEEYEKGLDVLSKAPMANGHSASLTLHAPYSCSPELYRLVDDHTASLPKPVLSIHNQENKDENELFLSASGPWRTLMEDWGFNTDWIKPYGKNSLPAMCDLLKKGNDLILVHNTFVSESDIDWAKQRFANLFFCTCPTANMYIEKSLPNYQLLLDTGVEVLVGTDSLASNYQLSILDELKMIKSHNPTLRTSELIQWATFNGAKAFSWADLGLIKAGKQPGLLHLSELDNGEITDNTSVERLI